MARFALVQGAALLLACLVTPSRSWSSESVSLGTGKSMVVELDDDFRRVRAYGGLHRPSDITPLPGGGLLLVDAGAEEVLELDAAGALLWRQAFGPGLQRARPRLGGGLVLTLRDKVVVTNSARAVEWELEVKGLRAAVEIPGGNLLAASDEGGGRLAEIGRDGVVRWSAPRAAEDVAGPAAAPSGPESFSSIVSFDVGTDGRIFTSDYDSSQLLLLASDYLILRRWVIPTLGHYRDTRIGPSGELIAVAPESWSVWLEQPSGESRTWTSRTNFLPVCANRSPRGTTLVGLEWIPEFEQLNASLERGQRRAVRPFRETLPGAVLVRAGCALLIVALLRWPDLRRRRATSVGLARDDGDGTTQDSAAVSSGASGGGMRRAALATVWIVLAASAAVALSAIGPLQGIAASGELLAKFALACLAGAIALRIVNALSGCSVTLSSFSPRASLTPARVALPVPSLTLLVLALASLGGCLYRVVYRPDATAAAVGLWVAAQILIVGAALSWPALASSPPRGRRRVLAVLGLLLVGSVALRFWNLDYYPDGVHWDHSIYGFAAMRILEDGSGPFFAMEPNWPSVSRPWTAICAMLLGVFGAHHWVLRLTAAVSGVALTLGVYLLGSSLFNRRVGLCAAFLAATNHVLVLYSRQPYVLDPAPLFVFAIYCATVGLRTGSRFHWCAAGLMSGWTVLTYWSSSALVIVGAVVFLGFAILYPRWLWRHRIGLLWMLAGAAIVYLPMLPHMLSPSNLSSRIGETLAVRWDAPFWSRQLRLAFGTILAYGDQSPWGLSTGKPIAIGPEACLFGIGLGYLLLSAPAAGLVLLVWLGVGILIGNALFADPRVVYHILGSIAPILLLSSVAVDRVLAPTDAWRSRWRRAVPRLMVLALLGAVGWSHLEAAWTAVRRSPRRPGDSRGVFRADVRSLVPRYVRRHPNLRYFLVRTPPDLTFRDPTFAFFTIDSDVSDVTGDLADLLPIPPVEPAAGAVFVVLPSRESDAAAITRVYGSVSVEEFAFEVGEGGSVKLYRVDAQEIRRVYEAAAATHRKS